MIQNYFHQLFYLGHLNYRNCLRLQKQRTKWINHYFLKGKILHFKCKSIFIIWLCVCACNQIKISDVLQWQIQKAYASMTNKIHLYFSADGPMLLLLLSRFSRVRLCATPWTVSHQAPPSMGFSRQKYWSGVTLPYLDGHIIYLPIL